MVSFEVKYSLSGTTLLIKDYVATGPLWHASVKLMRQLLFYVSNTIVGVTTYLSQNIPNA